MEWWRLSLLGERAARGFGAAGGTRLAAAISYYALLSLVPLLLVLLGVADLFLDADTIRDRLVAEIDETLPLTADGRIRLSEILAGAGTPSGPLGLVGLAGLAWTASGLMGAIRVGLSAVSGAARTRPALIGKLLDLALVLVSGVLLLGSLALTVFVRVAGRELMAPLDFPVSGTLWGLAVPLMLTFPVLAGALRWLPAEPIPWSGVWRGALFGGVGVWVTTALFALYLDNFGRYDVVYGSLGAVIAFLVFVYLAAIVLLMAAALAGAWPGVRSGGRPPENPYAPPMRVRLRGAVARLVRRAPS